jgi:NAD(P)-dependent dehydrogenase (short-subunit alcohol dehydrogenase family)
LTEVPPRETVSAPSEPAQTASDTTAENGGVSVRKVGRKDLEQSLIAMVGDRTGYPPDMLDTKLNLEADLGVDSIKRIEILAAFRKQYIPDESERIRELMVPVAREKTLEGILDAFEHVLSEHAGEDDGPEPPPDGPGGGGPRPRANGEVAAPSGELPRFVMTPTPAAGSSPQGSLRMGGIYLLTEDGGGVAASLAESIRRRGGVPLRLAPAGTEKGDARVIDLTDVAAIRGLASELQAEGKAVAGVFHCLSLTTEADPVSLNSVSWRGRVRAVAKSVFNLAHVFGPQLEEVGGVFVAATRLGGAFGFDDDEAGGLNVVHGGVPALLKTLTLEWPSVRCRSVDVKLDAGAQETANVLLSEALTPGTEVEVGFGDLGRTVLRAERRPLEPISGHGLESGDVVLVTGGARGITSVCVRELAKRLQLTFVLCGASPPPAAVEPADLATAQDERSLKAALIDRAKQMGESPRPAEIERIFRQTLKEREARETITALRQAGATVEYHQVDVRDPMAVADLIHNAVRTHGRIDCVIHGAGVIEDKLIADKDDESFDRVVDTKVQSVHNLACSLPWERLKVAAFFTSVAGRFGNRGQSDYAIANEIVSKFARLLNRRHRTRVVALSWGPWGQGGMVSDEVQRQFENRGIVAIDPALGARALAEEIAHSRGEPEVVWGEGPWRADIGTADAHRLSAAGD